MNSSFGQSGRGLPLAYDAAGKIRASGLIHSGFLLLPFVIVLWLFCLPSFAQRQPSPTPPKLNPIEAEREARALVADMLSQKPAQTNTGALKIRDAKRRERQVPIRFEIRSTATNTTSVYEAKDAGPPPRTFKLTVIHADNQPNQYFLSENGKAARTLSNDDLMSPFAGSDFYIADLGLEFLHWPQQRLLKKEMRKSRFCEVLESSNPKPGTRGYSRVVSWVQHEAPYGIVHADAYGVDGEVVKRFEPTEVEKVNGEYQLQEMEIRTVKTDTRTRIEFELNSSK